MNAILGYAHLASEEENLPDNIRDYLEKINASREHLLSLINDILEMSRIENGKPELQNENADIRETVVTAYDMVTNQMKEKKIDYKLNIASLQNRFAVFDRNRLLRLLINLLTNAYKFTPEGGAVLFSLTQSKCDDPKTAAYEISVKDTGIGMSEEFAKTVFEAFAREKTSTVSSV